MAQFRAKKLDLGCYINVRIIRDHTKRKVYEQYETQRQALRYIIRNTTLPQRARAQAQLQLSQMHCYTRFTQINNRCIEGGKSRGVFRAFRMARFPFRLNALEGNIPGVKKANLEGLGYFINDKDQVRSIKNPDQEFNFFISKNDRVNAVQREAHNTAIRTIIHSRLSPILNLTPVPINAPPSSPHIPIYTSPNISTCSRLILYIGESWQDLGVLAWRTIGRTSIAAGSIINLVHAIQQAPDQPGIVIANPGQLLWYRGGQRAVTLITWNALPRPTAVSVAMEISEEKNRVLGNRTPMEHVAHIFEEVIPKLAKADVAIDVMATGDGAQVAVEYLRNNWDGKAEKNVQAVAVGCGYTWSRAEMVGEGSKFRKFWGEARRMDMGCNCYSAGENSIMELIIPTAYKSMLSFFQLVNDVPGYREIPDDVVEIEADEEIEDVETGKI
ncbi:MAG: hypothetical protein LQ352_001012 [Teloschistes flavicans]|nr:MAG: hypothetical protein LQ352_001012 [Teloschistes flavicans]